MTSAFTHPSPPESTSQAPYLAQEGDHVTAIYPHTTLGEAFAAVLDLNTALHHNTVLAFNTVPGP
jgi:hypothetical protein